MSPAPLLQPKSQTMSNPAPFDPAAVAEAARRFSAALEVHPRARAIRRIEATLHGRGPVERLFAVEAVLASAWPRALGGPSAVLVSSTEVVREAETLILRALDACGAEVLRGGYALAGKPKASVHG
jgi:hypothetical protein